jgi:Neuraminidase (sialidase)
MALQGKITANRSIQSGGVKSKTIVARNMTISDSATLSSLTDVDVSQRDEGSMIIWDNSSSTFKVLGAIQNTNLQIIGGSF